MTNEKNRKATEKSIPVMYEIMREKMVWAGNRAFLVRESENGMHIEVGSIEKRRKSSGMRKLG